MIGKFFKLKKNLKSERQRFLTFCLIGCVMSLSPLKLSAQQDAQRVLDEQEKANAEARESQARIDDLSDEAQRALEDYTNTLRRIENLRVYNKQMAKYIESQEEEIASLTEQIDRVDETSQGITPLMLDMVETLDEFIALDVPFLEDERDERLAELRDIMNRADVTVSEKYRRVLEAFQTESQYGRTLESYRGIIQRDGKEMTVDFLRVGRLSLVYQSLDGRNQAYWDNSINAWVDLPGSYRRDIYQAIRVARGQVAPDLIKVPLKGPARL